MRVFVKTYALLRFESFMLAVRARRRESLALVTALALLMAPGARANEDAEPQNKPTVEDLGEGRFRIGNILIDKPGGRFTIPGSVIELAGQDVPLEFLAVTPNSEKDYEALLYVDSDAMQFNLACILIGLETDQETKPTYHFDPTPAAGTPVKLRVSWREGEREVSHDMIELLRGPDPDALHRWVYTGSFFGSRGEYVADVVGTLIGFVHDRASIIQHRDGLGLGNWGAIQPNWETLPEAGTAIVIEVIRADRADSGGAADG